MNHSLSKAAAVGAIVGIMGFGGYSFAQAQSTPSTTAPTTTQPEAGEPSATPPAPGTDDARPGHCDHDGEGRDGGGGAAPSTDSSGSGTTTDSSGTATEQ